jgi:uncharacterized sporulation protein YeaH/YhbH (DUF444 family)
MSRLTKVELLQANARLAADNELLRSKLSQLESDLEIANAARKQARDEAAFATHERRVTHTNAYGINAVARAQAMAAARELAIRTGRSIKVTMSDDAAHNEERRSISNDISYVC